MAPRRSSGPAAIDRERLASEVETFLAALADARLAAARGEPARAPVAAYQEHAGLFDRANVDALAAAAGEDPALRPLYALVTEGWLERQLADLAAAIATAEAQAVVIWRGERISYRALPGRIAEIADRGERNALHGAYEEAVEAINPLRAERFERRRELVAELGHGDTSELLALVRGIDPGALAGELRLFVNESETVFYAALRRYLAQIEIEQGDASLADALHLFRASSWDAWLDVAGGVPAVRATLSGLGVDLDGSAGIGFERVTSPAVAPAERTALALRGSDGVRFVVRPRAGYRAWGELLHAAGHVARLAHQPSAVLVEGGDRGLDEAWGYLLDALLLEPEWLAEHAGMDDDSAVAFTDFVSFRRLYAIRREVAILLYELRLHRSGDLRLARAYYGGLLSHLTGIIYPPARYLVDVALPFDSVVDLRGWLAAASVAEGLRRRFGAGWWRSADSAAWLREEWGRGAGARAEDAVAQLGYDRLDWRPVLRQIRTHLVGEMSGYGGPNITTRAGTRKV